MTRYGRHHPNSSACVFKRGHLEDLFATLLVNALKTVTYWFAINWIFDDETNEEEIEEQQKCIKNSMNSLLYCHPETQLQTKMIMAAVLINTCSFLTCFHLCIPCPIIGQPWPC